MKKREEGSEGCERDIVHERQRAEKERLRETLVNVQLSILSSLSNNILYGGIH